MHKLPQFVVIIHVQGGQIYNNLPTGFKKNKEKPYASIKYHFLVTDRFSRLRDNVQGTLTWGASRLGSKGTRENHEDQSKSVFQ